MSENNENEKSADSIERVVAPSEGFFLVSRTSMRGEEGKPCEEAFQVERLIVDRRAVDDPKKLPELVGGESRWYSKGTNHRIEDGMICRDIGWRKTWAVRVGDLTDLMAFVRKYGEVVISVDYEGFAELEIYDHYRE